MLKEKRDALHSKYTHSLQQLEHLQRANVYNDTFRINHDGTFATINKLRLGRLGHEVVCFLEVGVVLWMT